MGGRRKTKAQRCRDSDGGGGGEPILLLPAAFSNAYNAARISCVLQTFFFDKILRDDCFLSFFIVHSFDKGMIIIIIVKYIVLTFQYDML
jgi:hypothetical protein